MIKVGLMGGLGNILFQFARALSLRKAGHDVQLIHVIPRNKFVHGVIGWSFHQLWLDIHELATLLELEIRPPQLLDYPRVLSVFLNKRFEAAHEFDRNLHDMPLGSRGLDLGYFQSPSMICDSAIDQIVDAITVVIDQQCSAPLPTSELVVHLRGGDFLLQNRMTTSFFDKAVARFNNINMIVTIGNDEAYSSLFAEISSVPLENRSSDALSDFITLSRANKLVPSNSSFCFWAVAVAQRNHSISVLFPENSIFSLFSMYFDNTLMRAPPILP